MISKKEIPDSEDSLLGILNPHVKKWFFSRFKEFSLPQKFGVMEVHKRSNVLISAPTGATKTLTGFLSILNELIDSSEKGILEDKVYCIYISPLKALSNDIHKNLVEPLKEIEDIAQKKFNIRVAVRTGDTTPAEKAKMLKHPPHILITTPESVGILLSSIKFSQHLAKVDWLIIDEIHSLAENKRGVHLNISMERLSMLSPHMARIGLSATISPLEEVAKFLVGYDLKSSHWRPCKIIDVQFLKQLDLKVITPVPDLINTSYEKLHSALYKLMDELVQEHKTTVIFTNTRSATERVVHNLKELFPKHYDVDGIINIGAHHGSLGKQARLTVEDSLRQGKMKCVVTSTSLELGIDIGFIDLVICLGSPKSASRFLQRCLPYDAPVLLEDGTYRPIGEIVESKLPVSVVTFDSKQGFVPQRITKYHKSYTTELVEMKLRCGEIIFCTLEHPFLTKDGWKPAAKITSADKIGELCSAIMFNQKEQFLYQLLPHHLIYVYNANKYIIKLIDNYCLKNSRTIKVFAAKVGIDYRKLLDLRRQAGRNKSILLKDFLAICRLCWIPESEFICYLVNLKYKGSSWCCLPLKFTKKLLWLAGLIATDGCIVKIHDKRFNSYYYKIKFSNSREELVDKFKEALDELCINYYECRRPHDNIYSVEIGNNVLAYLLFSLGIPHKNKSSKLRMSDVLFRLDSGLIHSFLEGVFEGDGSYNKKYPLVRIFSGSPEFARQLHYLFARLGYHSHINVQKAKTSNVVKEVRIQNICCVTLTRVGDIKKFFSSVPLLGPKSIEADQRSKIFIQHHEKLSKKISDINWEDITYIKRTSESIPVYNLTVNKNSNFVVGNILTHNCGRSGHKLHEKVKARIIVMDRDDLVECSVLLKAAIEKKIDRIHIPTNCLDVLAQQVAGIAIADKIHIDTLHALLKSSYCFRHLVKKDLIDVIEYLAGRYVSLEERHIYAKIWYDESNGMIGKKGRMSRVIYMTNIGTIPEEHFIEIKIGEQTVGAIDEAFLEKLKKGDIFVLGGNVYEFKFARGMTAQVSASPSRPPTVPSWFSESLPLSFDLALEIGKFRRLMEDKFSHKVSKEDILQFIKEYLYVDDKTAFALHDYCEEQYKFSEIPHDKKIIIEFFDQENPYGHGGRGTKHSIHRTFYVFHTMFGRRVNDALSRSVAFAISRMQHRDVDIGVSDTGFFISCEKKIQAKKAFEVLKSDKLRQILENAIDKTEILARRFRHCAARALMILRNYGGRKQRVGRQQVSSMILLNAVKRIDTNFSILKEARREVLEDLMDIDNAILILKQVEDGKIKIKEISTAMPGPFALALTSQGQTDTLRIEDRMAYLIRMHQQVLARIALGKR